jgi:hypothetical protein
MLLLYERHPIESQYYIISPIYGPDTQCIEQSKLFFRTNHVVIKGNVALPFNEVGKGSSAVVFSFQDYRTSDSLTVLDVDYVEFKHTPYASGQ